jgi:5-methylthioadenosine/S-adenosylhomocysteine deaminase
MVMKEREILTVDVEEIRHRLARRRPEIMARYDALVA